MVPCGKALFRLGIRCRFGEDFLSDSKFRAQIKSFFNSNLYQNHALTKSKRCRQSEQYPNQSNICEGAASATTGCVRRERLDPCRCRPSNPRDARWHPQGREAAVEQRTAALPGKRTWPTSHDAMASRGATANSDPAGHEAVPGAPRCLMAARHPARPFRPCPPLPLSARAHARARPSPRSCRGRRRLTAAEASCEKPL